MNFLECFRQSWSFDLSTGMNTSLIDHHQMLLVCSRDLTSLKFLRRSWTRKTWTEHLECLRCPAYRVNTDWKPKYEYQKHQSNTDSRTDMDIHRRTFCYMDIGQNSMQDHDCSWKHKLDRHHIEWCNPWTSLYSQKCNGTVLPNSCMIFRGRCQLKLIMDEFSFSLIFQRQELFMTNRMKMAALYNSIYRWNISQGPSVLTKLKSQNKILFENAR